MLTGILAIVSPELTKVMTDMGHGDELVIADGSFPAVTNARRLVRATSEAAQLANVILKKGLTGR